MFGNRQFQTGRGREKSHGQVIWGVWGVGGGGRMLYISLGYLDRTFLEGMCFDSSPSGRGWTRLLSYPNCLLIKYLFNCDCLVFCSVLIMPYCIFPRSFIHYTTKVSDRSVLFQTIINRTDQKCIYTFFSKPYIYGCLSQMPVY